MMKTNPITPPPELLDEWCMDPTLSNWRDIATKAAQWGADQELEACVEWVANNISAPEAAELRAARRPKSPSLKEQALAVIENSAICDHLSPRDSATIRRALEALDD